ncbi:MAG: UDP-N-acetylmuramoyl-L-alanine--D-glutamate ligase [Bacteroidota bacterium]|jgi:UDP-N-acetylmuramoylalanine--D-glutamate ligase|nr:UDP-N-acetylmuramoyl-L-alanine--D-glutamate ligase [Algoriphagus sp.]
MKRIAILGAGESGLGAALLAKKQGYAVWVSDAGTIADSRKEQLQAAGIPFEEGTHDVEKLLSCELIVKSPGIPPTAEVVKKVAAQGIPVIDELEFAYRYSSGKVIAITGTNGKTTTTLLTYHLLLQAGWDVGLAGNVGKSWAAQLLEKDHAWWVIEVSSFQIDGFQTFKPHIAILTNITPDHLDRYGYEMDRYIQSKMGLFQHMGPEEKAICYLEDAYTSRGMHLKPMQAELYGISLTKKQEKGGYCGGETLEIAVDGRNLQIPVTQLSIQGKHNVLNALCAGVAAALAGLSELQISSGYSTFTNAPHRMEVIRTCEGVTYINDSKGTNVESTFYALSSFKQPILWIAGGVDKGNDYSQLSSVVDGGRVKVLICLGKDNEKLKKAFGGILPKILETQSMEEAIHWSQDLAQKGDVVLLSPACASFDLFKNYEDRGYQFRVAVEKLTQKQEA